MLLLSGFVMAQHTEGRVVYEEIFETNLETEMSFEGSGMDSTMMSDLEAQMMEMMANMPKPKKELLFNAEASIFQNFEEEKDEQFTGNNQNIMIVMDMPEDIFYSNMREGVVVEQRDLMGKQFLIEDELFIPTWKMTGETMDIAGYSCMKAEGRIDSTEYVAWFAPQIPVSTGPLNMTGLPGLILSLESSTSDITFVASAVELGEGMGAGIVAPDKGKSVSRKKFEKIQEEKMQEMEKMYGGSDGNSIFIEIEEH